MEDVAIIEGLAQEIRERLGYRVDVEPGEKLPAEASVYEELPPVPPGGGYAIKGLMFSILDGRVVFCCGSKLQPIGLGEDDLVNKVVSAVKGKLEAAAADSARIVARFREVNADRIAKRADESDDANISEFAKPRNFWDIPIPTPEDRPQISDEQLEEVRQRIRAMYGGPIKPTPRAAETHQ